MRTHTELSAHQDQTIPQTASDASVHPADSQRPLCAPSDISEEQTQRATLPPGVDDIDDDPLPLLASEYAPDIYAYLSAVEVTSPLCLCACVSVPVSLYLCLCSCVSVHVSVYMSVCLYVGACVSVHVSLCLCLCSCVCVPVSLCLSLFMCLCACLCACVLVHVSLC
jgi:hypothetical protein